MATLPAITQRNELNAELIATFPGLRVLAWDEDRLYACRGYQLLVAQMGSARIEWHKVASFRPVWWRGISSRLNLASRLFRDGFHSLAVLPGGTLVAAVPGAIVTFSPGDSEFRMTHRIERGTRPLHITTGPDGRVLWGEYFDNPLRSHVHIFASTDGALTWQVAYTFPRKSIRHVHNIVYDRFEDCFWIFTGDDGDECKILRASADFSTCDEIISGSQQSRAVAALVMGEGLYFSTDTPSEQNYVYFLDRLGNIRRLSDLPSSSIYGCVNRNGIFFSTMAEPSPMNRDDEMSLIGSGEGVAWREIARWRKDRWPMRFFQYGNVFLPGGNNTTEFLAATGIAAEGADFQTMIWRTSLR